MRHPIFFTFLTLVLTVLSPAQDDHKSWTLPAGDRITGTLESIDARGVLVKREDGNIALIRVNEMSDADRALHTGWLTGKSVPPEYAKPDTQVEIKTMEGALAYDLTMFQAKPGTTVHLTLKNVEELQHNLVVCSKQGEKVAPDLAMQAIQLGPKGMELEWIPESDSILAASKMVNPHETTHLYFRAPKELGEYAFVCTFPGHAQVMKGVMYVGERESDGQKATMKDLSYKLYEDTWTKLPNFDELTPVKQGPVKGNVFNMQSDGNKKANFGLVYTAKIHAPTEGEYTFYLGSDDGSRLFLDGKQHIIIDGLHAMKTTSATVVLHPGDYELRIDYFNRGGGKGLAAAWSGPGFADLPLTRQKFEGDRGNAAAGIPLFPPVGEAMMYRNFIEGNGTARGIAVGYNEGVHLAYDAQNGRIPMIWRGAFIDAKRHWTGRGSGNQPPAEKPVKADPEQQMVAALSSPDAPWPKENFVPNSKSKLYTAPGKKPSAYQFIGYELNEKRHPTFMWHFDGVEVRDCPQPMAKGFKRLFTMERTRDGESEPLYMRFQPSDQLDISVEGNATTTVGSEIRVPIEFSDGKAEFSVIYTIK